MLQMLKNVMGWVGAVLLFAIGATIFEYFSVNTEIKNVKMMIATGDRASVAAPKKRFALSEKTEKLVVLIARCVIGALAVAFIIAGIFNGGTRDVLIKAINICMECIGLG